MADSAYRTIRHLFIMFNNCKKHVKYIRYYVCIGDNSILLYLAEYEIRGNNVPFLVYIMYKNVSLITILKLKFVISYALLHILPNFVQSNKTRESLNKNIH